jgi:hypothetical protein
MAASTVMRNSTNSERLRGRSTSAPTAPAFTAATVALQAPYRPRLDRS